MIEIKEKDVQRFWEKVNIKGKDDCWEWIAAKNSHGYGNFSFINNKKRIYMNASRYSYILTNGDITNNLFVLHSCDNPSCVNPNHLRLGTQHDNIDDMMKRKRNGFGILKGSKNKNSKLTEENVIEIRNLFNNKLIPISYIKNKFNIGETTVREVAFGMTWKHLGNISNKRKIDKLNYEKAEEIRRLYKTGNFTHKDLGIIYNVVTSAITDIINYKRWKSNE